MLSELVLLDWVGPEAVVIALLWVLTHWGLVQLLAVQWWSFCSFLKVLLFWKL
jgi:hypothetical protein